MTDQQLPPPKAAERRENLMQAIRRGGGTWDWRRARETYEPRPDPKRVRGDLQKLCKDRLLVRVGLGEYQMANRLVTGTIGLDGQPVGVICNLSPHQGEQHHDNVLGAWSSKEQK